MKAVSVTFNGEPLVLIRFADGEGALAYPHQITPDGGGIKLECRFEPGFAHIDSDGQVWRHNSNTDDANYHPDLAAAWKSLR